jgi:hypothetical protein
MVNTKLKNLCVIHGYYGQPIPGPTERCKNCAEVYLKLILALTPGDYQENLDKLEALIHGIVELEQEGKFDYVPYAHPEVTIS